MTIELRSLPTLWLIFLLLQTRQPEIWKRKGAGYPRAPRGLNSLIGYLWTKKYLETKDPVLIAKCRFFRKALLVWNILAGLGLVAMVVMASTQS